MERSRWGWGWVERSPNVDALRARAGILFADLVEEPPVIDGAIVLPDPRVPIPPALAGFATASATERMRRSYGKSYPDRLRGFRGEYPNPPDFVARPLDEDDVRLVLEVAAREGLAVVPFGGGSSVVGGVETILPSGLRGVVSLDLGRLDRVLHVDARSRLARVQAGVLGPSLEAQLGERGFTFRHFPQSFEFSSVGGWIVTRAGGHFATVYTHVDDLVNSVRMVTPNGVIETKRLPASGAGPDPNRLVFGSEGTLGVVTEATLRVRPRPTFRSGANVRFKDFDAAVDATRAIAQSGLNPANCRLLDPMEAMLNGVALDGSAVLVLAFESAVGSVRGPAEQALGLALAAGGTCKRGVTERGPGDDRGTDDASAWRDAFLEGPYLQDGMIRLGVIADTFETACTWDAFPALHRAIVERTMAAIFEHAEKGIVTCRFTHVYPDGPAPYYTFLGRAKKGDELEQWAAIKRAAGDALAAHGGTITHHHAVGRMHRPWYDRECPALYGDVLRAAKRTLDPAGVLNRGVLFDP